MNLKVIGILGAALVVAAVTLYINYLRLQNAKAVDALHVAQAQAAMYESALDGERIASSAAVNAEAAEQNAFDVQTMKLRAALTVANQTIAHLEDTVRSCQTADAVAEHAGEMFPAPIPPLPGSIRESTELGGAAGEAAGRIGGGL